MKFLKEERKAVLQQFAKLSGREQELQRRSWVDELQVLEEDLTILRRRLEEAKRKRSRLRQNIGMARVQSIKSSLACVRTGLEEKLMALGEKTEERAVELEEKIGRLAKRSMQHIMTAVTSATAAGPSSSEQNGPQTDSLTSDTTSNEKSEQSVSEC